MCPKPTQELPIDVADAERGLVVLLDLIMQAEATQPAVERQRLNEAHPIDARPAAVEPARPGRGYFVPFPAWNLRLDFEGAGLIFAPESHEVCGTGQSAVENAVAHPASNQIRKPRRQAQRGQQQAAIRELLQPIRLKVQSG